MSLASLLTEVELRLEDAINHLHEQQSIVHEADCGRIHDALVRLLANGLRSYCYIEGQRNALIEQLGEHLPWRTR